MSASELDDPAVRRAMQAYLDAADRLDEVSRDGAEPRQFIDAAEEKSLAAMVLRRRLAEHGWCTPEPAQRVTT
jgi:hypothetical protein